MSSSLSRWAIPAVVALIAYGSLYPFEFDVPPAASWVEVWRSLVIVGPSRGDLVANLLLYMPLGFLLSSRFSERSPVIRFGIVAMVAAGLSCLIELLQQLESARVSSLVDVFLNVTGAMAGMALHSLFLGSRVVDGWGKPRLETLVSLPAFLVVAWFLGRTSPFVPTIDWQAYKAALSPLLAFDLDSTFWIGVWRHAAAWLVIGAALRVVVSGRPRFRLYLLLLLAATLAAQVVIVGRELRMSELLGATCGAAVCWFWHYLPTRRFYWGLVAVVAISVVLDGLRPFSFSTPAASFGWVPFAGSLTGNMEINLLALIEKVFYASALLWLCSRAGVPGFAASGAVAFGFGAIEYVQRWLPGRTPEITDPLLVLLVAGLVARLGDHARTEDEPIAAVPDRR